MSGAQRIPGPQLTAPVVQGPQIQRQDVSSGLMAVAEAKRTIENAQDARALNDAQLGAMKAFREHDEELRKLPWDQKVAKFEENAKEIRATYLDSMPGYLKQQFSGDFERMYGSYRTHTRDDAYKGEKEHALQTVIDGGKDYENIALTARTPQELQIAKEALAGSWRRLAEGGYISADDAKNGAQAAFASGDLIRAQKLIQTNPWEAKKALNDPSKAFPFLDAKHVPSLMNQADGEARSREAQVRAQQAQARAEAAIDAGQLIQSDIIGRQTLGKGVSVQDQARIRAGLTDKQWEKYQAEAKRADAVYSLAGDLTKKSNAEIEQTLAKSAPKLNPDGTAPADLADQQAAYRAAQGIAKQIIAKRKADPATAAREAVPNVQWGWDTYANNPEPGNLRVAIKRTLAAQTAMGIPSDQQKPLPAQMALAIAGDIRGAPANKAAEKLKEQAAQFGENWPKVFAQIAPHLDANSMWATTLDDHNKAAILLETSRVAGKDGKPGSGVNELRTSLGVPSSGTGSIKLAVAEDGDVRDLMTAMARRGGGGSTAVTITDAAETLALGLMQRNGISAPEAADQAVKALVRDKYNFARVNGVPFVTPKSVDADTAEMGARAMLERLKSDGLDLPFADPGAVDADTRDQYVSAIKRKGYWVTLPGNKGLELWAGDAPVTRYGQRMQYTWDQLQGIAPPTSAGKRGYGSVEGR